MKYPPKHPDNPCHLSEQEQVPAKVWELLRRNEAFRRRVACLKRLDHRARTNDPPPQRAAWHAALRRTQLTDQQHEFAGVALKWLVPEPLFTVRRWRVPCDLELKLGRAYELECFEEGEGTTPDPTDAGNWRWGTSSWFNLFGRRICRGPELKLDRCEDGRFSSQVDVLADWRDYPWPFTLEHSWPKAPPGFQRTFRRLWAKHDSRIENPATGRRGSEASAHETTFFAQWDIGAAFVKAAQSGALDDKSFARCLMFHDLATDYRVFALPRNIRTRMEARRLAKWMLEQLTRLPDGTELPRHEKVILGTPLQWDMLLVYEDRRRQGVEHTAALQYTFDTLYVGLPEVRRKAAKPAERTPEAALRHRLAKPMLSEAESTRWHSWIADFGHMYAPTTGAGFVQRIFPANDLILPATSASPAP